MDRNQAKMLIKRLLEDNGKKDIIDLLYDNGFIIESRLIDEDDKEIQEEPLIQEMPNGC